MYHRRLPLARCHRGRAGTALPCHGGISRALCKCSSPPSPPLHLTVTTWSWLPSWSLLHALLECCSMLFWSLLRAGHAHLDLAWAKLTWSLCWPCCSGACAGQNLLPSAALGFFPSLYWCCDIQWLVLLTVSLHFLAVLCCADLMM
jgi:hypothetical protein